MNNTFNIKRFGLVFRKDLIENGKRYLLLFLTMLGLITLVITLVIPVLTFNYYDKNLSNQVNYMDHNRVLLTWLSFLFFGFGTWFASTFSTPMNSKLKRLSYLASPSSNLEKYFVRWSFTTIGFICAFFVASWVSDMIRVALYAVVFPTVDVHFLDLTKFVAPKEAPYSYEYILPKDVFTIMTSIYFFTQSVFLLGSTFWDKASFIKTFTAVTIIITVYSFICRWVMLLCYGSLDGYSNVLDSFALSERYSQEQAITIVVIVISVFTLTNWILAYFRLKESEIIKRL